MTPKEFQEFARFQKKNVGIAYSMYGMDDAWSKNYPLKDFIVKHSNPIVNFTEKSICKHRTIVSTMC